MLTRDKILDVVKEWEKEYYDEPTNNIQWQQDSHVITVHNRIGAVNPRAQFVNKLKFGYWPRFVYHYSYKRRVITDVTFMNDEAIEKLRVALEECIYG